MQSAKQDSGARTFLEATLELVWPTRCAGCERPGELLCEDCSTTLPFIEQRYACPCCGAPYGHLVCTECYSGEGKETHAFSHALAVTEMNEVTGRIVVLYKDNNERRLSKYIAQYLYSCIPEPWLAWAHALSWISVDKKALRRRGFDHMERIAHDLGGLTGLPALRLLNKQPCRDQRKLGRVDRMHNQRKSFSLANKDASLPQRILLIDDVCTTGATLDAAAALLTESGAEEVRVASFVRVW